MSEVVLPDWRRADVVGLSQKGDIWIVEIKSCADDFKTDLKWRDYMAFCDRLFFAVSPSFPADLLPQDIGLIVADAYAGEVVRMPDESRLSGARRASMLRLVARLAAQRIYAKDDPDFVRTTGWIET